LKTNEPILMEIVTSGPRGTINFCGQEVKDQGDTTPKLDLMTWRRHRNWPLRSSRLSSLCRTLFKDSKL